MSAIISSDWFKINDISSDTAGIYVDTPSIPPMAHRRFSEYQTGFDIDEAVMENSWDNVDYSLTFYTFYSENFDNSDVYGLFSEPKTLQISRLPGKYFKIRGVSVSSPYQEANGNKIIYTADFTLAPFKYDVNDTTYSPTLSSGSTTVSVGNTGTIYSRPKIIIKASGDVAIVTNGETFSISGLTPSVETVIDSDRMITYQDTTLINTKTTGKYPLLAVGNNPVSFIGNFSSITIHKNLRWL